MTFLFLIGACLVFVIPYEIEFARHLRAGSDRAALDEVLRIFCREVEEFAGDVFRCTRTVRFAVERLAFLALAFLKRFRYMRHIL